MTELNETERRRWNDPGWTAAWPKREPLTDMISPSLLSAAAIQADEDVLDVGCGGGRLTHTAAALARTVVGADFSAQLLELARSREGAATFIRADVQADDLGGPYDLIMSQFGVMFFEDPVAAFTNMRRHLRGGGRLVFACWQEVGRNPWFPGPVLMPFLPAPPAPGSTGPFAFGDASRVEGILADAGWTGVQHEAQEMVVRGFADAISDDSQMRFMGVPEESLDAAREAVFKHLERFKSPDGTYDFPIAFQIFRAT